MATHKRDNGYDVTAHIAELRVQRERLIAEREATERAPLTHNEAEAQLEQRIESLAGRVQFDVAPLVSLPSVAPQRRSLYRRADARVPLDAEELLAAVTAHVWPERVRQQASKALADFYASTPAGLPMAQRTAKVEQISQRLGDVERDEETQIRTAEERGLTIDRRVDCDPAVVLAEQLPSGPPSLDRLRQFVAVAKRRYDALRGADARRLEALDERGKYAGRLAAAEQDVKRFPGGAGPALAAHRERAEQAQATLDAATHESEELTSQWQLARQLADACTKFARTVGLALEPALDPAPIRPVSQLQRLGTYDPALDRVVPC